MRKTTLIISTLVALLAATLPAQAQRSTAKKAQPVAEETSAADILYEEMLPSTAKVLFVDSLVTDRKTFISHILIGGEAGTLSTYADYFHTKGQSGMHVYVNELGNKRYYTRLDSAGHTKLYTQDKLGRRWSDEQEVTDFGDEYEDIINPFMMGDGQTFYFAARGSHGLGGYDIYVTRYNTAASRFYRPENIGLPYNSPSDDIALVIDEFNNIGWLVTDRRQADGQVCVYSFVPQTTRQTYGDVGDDELRSLAALHSIRRTWTDATARAEATATLDRLRSTADTKTARQDDIAFVINDHLTYHSVGDFSTAALRERFEQLQQTRRQLAAREAELQLLRDRYATASAGDRLYMKGGILAAEDEVYTLQQTICQEEKEIRNAENRALGN